MSNRKRLPPVPVNHMGRPKFDLEALVGEYTNHLALAKRYHACMIEAEGAGQAWQYFAALTQIEQNAALLCRNEEQMAMLVCLFQNSSDEPEELEQPKPGGMVS